MSGMSKLIAVAALVLSVGAAGACNRGPDPEDQVENALKQANLKDVDVKYDRTEQVVHLKGAVDSPGDKMRAEEIATSAVGTSGKVLNELTVKGVDESTADNNDGRIRDRLKEAVNAEPMLRDRDISFDVHNGAVEIKGVVRTADEKARVAVLVRDVPDVKDVANALEVNPEKVKGAKPPYPNR